MTERAYDSLDRLTERWDNGRLAQELIYDRHPAGYSPVGELQPNVALPTGELTVTRVFDPNNLYDYEEQRSYSLRGDTVNRTTQLGQRTFVENFGYTLDGAQTAIVTPRGLREGLSLNSANRLSGVSVSGSSFTQPEPVIEQVTYNAKNQIAGVGYRLGAKTTLAYDPRTLLTTRIDSSFNDGTADQPLQGMTYDIDSDLKIMAIHDLIGESVFGAVNRSGAFEYDWRGQLTKATRYQQSTGYAYDSNGGFVSNDELPGTWRQGADTALLPLGTDKNPFAYDAFGRLQQSPEIDDTRYDTAGQLLYAHTRTGQTISYAYGPEGERYYKHIVAADGTVTESLYPVKSYSEEPSGAQSFVFVGSKRLVRFDHGQAAGPDRWFYYLEDHIGSNDILMSADGRPVEQNLYFPYGSEAQASDLSAPWASYLATNAASVPREKAHHRYTGHYLDEETGLYYFGARYYHPKLARFVTPDPLFLAQPEKCEKSTRECNLYGYANNNPIKYYDPDGRLLQLAAGVSPTYQNDYQNMINYLDKSATGAALLQELNGRSEVITIRPPSNARDYAAGPHFDPATNQIVIDLRQGSHTSGGKDVSPALIFAHESDHALRALTDPAGLAADARTRAGAYGNKEEQRVIQGSEQAIARDLHEIGPTEVTRTDHSGSTLQTVGCSSCTEPIPASAPSGPPSP